MMDNVLECQGEQLCVGVSDNVAEFLVRTQPLAAGGHERDAYRRVFIDQLEF
jgi:hypothetical protein